MVWCWGRVEVASDQWILGDGGDDDWEDFRYVGVL